ncbi:uncharacterized protein LOC107158314 [Marmota marmota marmota]|uniref:uncharacterized protein LOC107158314 n=1 Tax=Marmota marmota marmota TaxID=9994 RepID=UPI0007624ACE|nr:uncharacterized protein LOC107158314 [Marmota marmota marmota]
MHKSHSLDPPSKAEQTLATRLLRPVCPVLMSPGTHCSQIRRCRLSRQRLERLLSPGGKQDFLLFLGPVPESFQGLAGEKGSNRRRHPSALPCWGPGCLQPRLAVARGGREEAGAFRARPLPRVPWLPERGACPRVCSHLAGAGESAQSCSVPGAGEVGAGGANATRLTSAAAAAGRVAPSGQWGNGKECGGFKQNSMSLPGCCQTAGLPRSRARQVQGSIGKGGFESVFKYILGATVPYPATLGSFWTQGTQSVP